MVYSPHRILGKYENIQHIILDRFSGFQNRLVTYPDLEHRLNISFPLRIQSKKFITLNEELFKP